MLAYRSSWLSEGHAGLAQRELLFEAWCGPSGIFNNTLIGLFVGSGLYQKLDG